MSGFVLKLCAPRKYIFKIRFMFQSNKNSIDFSKDDLFTVNLKIEKCQLYIIKDVVIIKTLGKAGRLIEIGGVGTRTPSGQPWNLHRIQGFYLSYQNPSLQEVVLNLWNPRRKLLYSLEIIFLCPPVRLFPWACCPLSIPSYRPFVAKPSNTLFHHFGKDAEVLLEELFPH